VGRGDERGGVFCCDESWANWQHDGQTDLLSPWIPEIYLQKSGRKGSELEDKNRSLRGLNPVRVND